MRLNAVPIFVAMLLFGSGAVASPSSQKIFGHRVEIKAVHAFDRMGGEILSVDGHSLHKNAILDIDEIGLIGGIGVVVGTSANGGNMCDDAPFVLSFPPKSPAHLDGPLPTCFSTTYVTMPDRIMFSTKPLPGQMTQVWFWTPTYGFKAAPDRPYQSNAKLGWNELRTKTINHPSEIYAYAEIAQQIDRTLGMDKASVFPLIDGVGSGEFKGDLYVGTGCRPHACGDAGVLVIADIQRRIVFLAWKLEGKPLIVRPEAKAWPDDERFELLNWSKNW